MKQYDSARIEKLKELIKPAFDLKIMPPDNYHPLLTFQAQRNSPHGIVMMVVKIPEPDFKEEYCVEEIAHAFEVSYQEKIK